MHRLGTYINNILNTIIFTNVGFHFIDREKQEVEAETEYSKLKSSICCPPNILNVLLAQTEMTEGQIHVEYMKFKNEYPTGR